MTPEEGEFDTRLGLELLRRQFGQALVSRWRPPYGSRADWQRGVAERLCLRLTWWSVDSGDWQGVSAEEMAAAIRPRLRDGTILLMHDGIGPGARRDGAGETVRLIELLARDGVAHRTF
jgi:peptidoglycan/xylan/chitin deacetylase (PgdA/CDA1 family)